MDSILTLSEPTTSRPNLFHERPPRTYPFAGMVPTDPAANLDFRKTVRDLAADDLDYRHRITDMCARDSLFWLTTFCVLFEPRPEPQILPFIPWSNQVPVWKELERWLGVCDLGLEKSRGEGASWMITMLCLHKWIYLPMFAAGFVSKDEASVDNPENPDSLFWKIQFQLDHLPFWMMNEEWYDRSRKDHTFVNELNGATLSGFAATGTVASGGRKTVMVMDELGKFPRGFDQAAMNSTQHVTDCRWLIGTPTGPEGAYFEAMCGDNNMRKLVLDWTKNPTRNQGAYKVLIESDNSRRVELVDYGYWMQEAADRGRGFASRAEASRAAAGIVDETDANPFGYPFMLTGPFVKHDSLRSPWYDLQCQRPNATPQSIAQELDRDYGGATSRFFDANMLVRMQKLCFPPHVAGEMALPAHPDGHDELQKCKFKEMYGGRLKLWFKPDVHGRVPQCRSYVIGVDISAGGGGVKTSNSALEIVDYTIGRQVGEFLSPQIAPDELADLAVALCYWFNHEGTPAVLIWEANGPNGSQFGQRITQLGFSNIYYRGTVEEYTEAETRKMGWWSSNKTKPALLGEWARAVAAGQLEVNSYQCLEEAKSYVNKPGGKVEHIAQSAEKDPSGAGERHGDPVIGLALAWWVAKDYVQGEVSAAPVESLIPVNCVLGRRLEAKRQQQQDQRWVPPSQARFTRFGR